VDENPLRALRISQSAAVYRPLGAFRFLLASMVVVSHTRLLAGESLQFLAPLGIGNMGVMTFFILSGYVIAEATNVFYRNREGAFLLNRALRIYPPFFVALALSIGIHALLSETSGLKFYDHVASPDRLFDTQNVAANVLSMIVLAGVDRLGLPLEYPFVRYSWAIVVELQFYVVFAVLLALAKGRVYWIAVTALLLGAFIAAMPSTGFRGWMPYFMLGICMFHFPRRWALALGAVSLALVNWHAYQYVSRNSEAHVLASVAVLDLLILALWKLSVCRMPNRLLRLDKFLGDLTYPLYLNHYAVSIVMLSLFAGRPSVALFVGTFVLAVVFSYAAMQCTEPLTRTLRDRIRGMAL
jgi:peptidoglycan/LPS O-acetylase OafA/YrhL